MHCENQNQGHAERLQTRRRIDLRDMQLHIHDIRVTCEALGKMRMTLQNTTLVETAPCGCSVNLDLVTGIETVKTCSEHGGETIVTEPRVAPSECA
jgi:hypothetical protein